MKCLIYGSKGWIGTQFLKVIPSSIEVVCGNARCDDASQVRQEIDTVQPTHVYCFLGRTHGTIEGRVYSTIDYLEQPLPPQNLNDSYELRMNSSIPIAIDEFLTDYFSAEKIIKESAADVLIIKPTLSGGYDDIDKIIGLCQQEKIRWIMTSSFETQVAQNSILHLIATYNTKEFCGLFNIKLFSDEVYANIERSKYIITQNKG